MILKEIQLQNLISPPRWLCDNTIYLTIMGSEAYGISTDKSDKDIYGICIPPKKIVFPHLDGEILGLGKQSKRFDNWQEHHISYRNKEYDFSVYSIVRYFQLCMKCNPNMIDSLFVDQKSIIHSTHVSNLIRENRHLFLHKGAWSKFKGYAYSQLHKMRSQSREGKRKEVVEKFGFDVKFAYHIIRLLSEIEQILTHHTLELNVKDRREHMKAIRRGEVKKEDILLWAQDKERQLEKLYHSSSLPYKPDEGKIKGLLLNCLEHHYGSLDKCIVLPDKNIHTLNKIIDVLVADRLI